MDEDAGRLDLLAQVALQQSREVFGDTGLDEGAEVGRLGAGLGALHAPLPGSRVASKKGVGTRTRAGLEAGPSGSPAELRRTVLEKGGREVPLRGAGLTLGGKGRQLGSRVAVYLLQ